MILFSHFLYSRPHTAIEGPLSSCCLKYKTSLRCDYKAMESKDENNNKVLLNTASEKWSCMFKGKHKYPDKN